MKFIQVITTSLCMAIGFMLPLKASEPIKVHSTEPILISQVTTWQSYGFEEAQFSAQFLSEPETPLCSHEHV